MINAAVQEGTPTSIMELKKNGSFNYPFSPSLSARLKHAIQPGISSRRISSNSAKEVYQTVVVPTVFPAPPSHQQLHFQHGPVAQNAFYQAQCCNNGININNNKHNRLAGPYQSASGLLNQQWPATASSFMQHQLHQFRKQQLQQYATAASPDNGIFSTPNTAASVGKAILVTSFSKQHQWYLSQQQQLGQLDVTGRMGSPLPQHRTGSVQSYEESVTVNPMATCSQQTQASPSPKRSSRRHHHGHHHFGQTSGGAYDLLESDALQRRHKFPSNFCRILRELAPPVPPVLLRPLPGSAPNGGKAAAAPAVPRYKDPASRLKVTLRVLPSALTSAGGGGSPEASFLTVDSRKKQATLIEQAQSQRQSSTAVAQLPPNGASAAAVPKVFNFDAVFSPDDSQTEICSTTLTDTIQTVVNEGDACVLMFGSAEQGKLHTSIGSDTSAQALGIIPCAISWLYRVISEVRQRTGAHFSIRVSAVEVSGPQEDLRDLLADLASVSHQDASAGYEACLREDPVFGTQLHNVHELRAPTPDKAAFYLDAALAKRNASTEEERRNSHFFYTLHIYQYRVNEKQQGTSDQEKVDAVGVAGGRTRLHLIDLGVGEKSSKPGRASLTFPALGNVLLTLLQGQKHLPFKESKVTQILKSFIGSTLCKGVSVVACASSDPERRMESVNVVQIAGRLYRIRRTKRSSAKFGIGPGNSSGGESSTDERARRRFPRSASDPDCTTSSSEQSCDTVIYLGAGGARPKNGSGVGGSSSVAISDQDIAPTVEQGPSCSGKNVQMKPLGVAYDKARTTQVPGRPLGSPRGGKQLAVVQPSASPLASNTAQARPLWIDGPKACKQPKLQFAQSANPAVRVVGQQDKSAPIMDPFKREMIRQWVVNQEQERSAVGRVGEREIWIDRCPKAPSDSLPVSSFEGAGARPKQLSPQSSQIPHAATRECQDDLVSVHSMSIENSSTALSTSSCSEGAPMETRDIALQCCEEEIDFDCGRYKIPLALYNDNEVSMVDNYPYLHNNNTVNQEYAAATASVWTEPEMRMLEDIAEVEEEEITASSISDRNQMTASKRSSLRGNFLVAAASGSPPYRNEGMAPMPETMQGDVPILFAAASSSSLHSMSSAFPFMNDEDEHPLRILSKERGLGESRSDTVSLGNDDAADAFSVRDTSDLFFLLGGTQLIAAGGVAVQNLSADEDSSSMTDEDLERAMQASLTSIRSHEILEKLKSEGKLRRRNEEDEENQLIRSADDGAISGDALAGVPADQSTRMEPEGEGSRGKIEPYQKGSTGRDEGRLPAEQSVAMDRVTKPTVPQLAKPIANLVMSQLISGLSGQNEEHIGLRSNRSASQKQEEQHHSSSSTPISVVASEEQASHTANASAQSSPRSSLPRPTKLASPRSQEKIPSSKSQPLKQPKEGGKGVTKCEKEKLKTANTACKLSQSKTKGAAKSVATGPAVSGTPTPAAPAEKAKTKAASGGSVLKSPIMSFLKSPSKSKKATPSASTTCSTSATNVGAQTTLTGVHGSPATASCKSVKRASSGYDSGHDSGIVTVDSPDTLLASPYSKLTKPRSSQRSSSGHGSDNSSAVSSDTGGTAVANSGKLGKSGISKLTPVTKLGPAGKSKKLIASRDCTGGATSSSGYESALGREKEAGADDTATTSPESSDNAEQMQWKGATLPDVLKSPPSVKLHRRRWFDGLGFDSSKSRSAPQSPDSAVTSPPASRLHRFVDAGVGSKSRSFKQGENMTMQERVQAVEKLRVRQNELKEELKLAKDRLGVPQTKWSYDLHVSECMDITNPNMLEALEQETKILEKRVAACQSHILMVTVFDAVPSVAASPAAARKCS